jgi:predicted ATPase
VRRRRERNADEYCLDMWAALGHVNHGWALSEQGSPDEGLREMRRGLDAYEATGGKLWRAHFLGLLAEALAGVGRAEEGLATVTEGLALANATGEMCSTAELHRIHGDLLLMPSRGRIAQAATQAEAAFDRALAIAQEQRAKSWETKVAMSRDRWSRAR